MRTVAAVSMLLALAPAVAAQQATPTVAEIPTISVSATGTVHRTPDQAVVSLAVENVASNARNAAQQNAQRMEAVIRAIRQAGIPSEHIRTSGYNLMPEYQYTQPTPTRPGEQKLTGYRATNMVQVTVDSIARVGPVIDAAIAAGANRANGVNFQLRDPEAVRREALRLAVAHAREDAETLAQASGRQLGTLLQLSTTGAMVPPPVPMMMRAGAMAAEATTPVEPGEMDITATVLAVYRVIGGGAQPQ